MAYRNKQILTRRLSLTPLVYHGLRGFCLPDISMHEYIDATRRIE